MEPEPTPPSPTPSLIPSCSITPRLDIDIDINKMPVDDGDNNESQQSPTPKVSDKEPIILSLRSPGPEDPAKSKEAPKYEISTASDLGLLDDGGKPRLIAFKFPKDLPFGIGATSPSNKGTAEKPVEGEKGKGMSSKDTIEKSMEWRFFTSFEELAQGCTGKLLVYKSGAVKFTMGGVLYSVSTEPDPCYSERVMTINAKDGVCFDFGQVTKKAVVTVDTDCMLED